MNELESIMPGAVQGYEYDLISSHQQLHPSYCFAMIFKVKEGGITFGKMLYFGTLLAILTLCGRKFLTVLIEGLRDQKERNLGNSLLFKIVDC